MAIEIERKWLVKADTPIVWGRSLEIKQGYLYNKDKHVCRVRSVIHRHISVGGVGRSGYITVKGPSGSSHGPDEYEMQIPYAFAEKMLQGIPIIHKTRYEVVENGFVCERDIFHSPEKVRGLDMVEVEFEATSDAETFAVPLWFGKEVTNDPAYTNANMLKG